MYNDAIKANVAVQCTTAVNVTLEKLIHYSFDALTYPEHTQNTIQTSERKRKKEEIIQRSVFLFYFHIKKWICFSIIFTLHLTLSHRVSVFIHYEIWRNRIIIVQQFEKSTRRRNRRKNRLSLICAAFSFYVCTGISCFSLQHPTAP